MARDLQVNILAPSDKFEAGVKRMEASARQLHASELRLIATEERLEKLRSSGKATAGQLASAQASLISAQDRVAKANGATAAATEQAGRRSSKAFEGISTAAASMSAGVGLAASAGGAAVVAFARDSVAAASDLQEQMSATKTIFRDAADEVLAFGDSASAIGVSKTAALEAANSFGDLFTKIGYTSKASATFSEDLVRMAADFASFKNIDPSEALEKLRSGLAGESEPLRSLGVFLTEAKVKAEAMRLGLVPAHGELDEGAKVAARYSLIISQMGDAYGDVDRTANSYANTQRRFAAETEDLQASIGQGLLPVLTDLQAIAARTADALNGAAEGGSGVGFLERGFPILRATTDLWHKLAGNSEEAKDASYDLADSQALLAAKQARTQQEVQASVQEVEKQQKALEDVSPVVRAYAEELGLSADAIKKVDDQLNDWGQSLASAIDPLGAYTDTLKAKDDAERKSAEATAEGTKSAKDSWEDYFQTQSVSFDEYVAELQRQVEAQQDWSANMLQLAGRVSQGTLDELARMGPEGAPLVAEMVTKSDAELAKLEPLLAARTKDAVDGQALQWRQWGVLAPQLTAKIGKDAVAGLAKELEAGTTTVADISRRYAFELAGGITPLLRAVGKNGVTLTDINRDVAMVQRRATGGPVWGAGTATSDSIPALLSNGEYVIRASSVTQYGQDFFDAVNAGRFAIGGLVRRFAAGGFASVGAVPKPPTSGLGGPPVSTAAAATMDTAYQAAIQAVQTLAPQLMSFTGGQSAKGLNPQFLQMFNAYNAAIGGVLKIVSGWRSSAQQANLYQRWLNRVPGQAPAAPPGRSNHERGLAIDHSPHSTAAMRSTASRFGLRYPMSYEPWHVEPANISRGHARGGPVRRMASGGPITRARAGAVPAGMVRAEDGSLVPRSFYMGAASTTLTGAVRGLTDPAAIRAAAQAWEDHNKALLRNRKLLADLVAAQKELAQARATSAKDVAQAKRELDTDLKLAKSKADRAQAYKKYDDVVRRGAEARSAAYRNIAEAQQAIKDQKAEDALDRERTAVDRLVESLERQAEARRDALDTLNSYLDQAQAARDRGAQAEQRYADKVASVQQRSAQAAVELAQQQQRLLDERRDQLSGWARLDELAAVQWGNSVEQLLANARSQAAQFEEWSTSLAAARGRGVSEQVIAALGLDQGPQALGQLRAFGQATQEEIDALNAEVARRTAAAGAQVSREQQAGYGELGRALQAAHADYTEALAQLNEELVQAQADLLVEQAEVATELAAIGKDQARSYGEALEQGLRSQIPAVLAAAQALQAAAGGATANATMVGGKYVDTMTGRLAYYGPAGEPGYASAKDAPAGAKSYKMPDGRTAYYVPKQTFDVGGWLQPGWTMAFNGTGQPERVMTAQQAQSGGLTININGPVFGVDDLHRQIRAGADALLAERRDAARAHA